MIYQGLQKDDTPPTKERGVIRGFSGYVEEERYNSKDKCRHYRCRHDDGEVAALIQDMPVSANGGCNGNRSESLSAPSSGKQSYRALDRSQRLMNEQQRPSTSGGLPSASISQCGLALFQKQWGINPIQNEPQNTFLAETWEGGCRNGEFTGGVGSGLSQSESRGGMLDEAMGRLLTHDLQRGSTKIQEQVLFTSHLEHSLSQILYALLTLHLQIIDRAVATSEKRSGKHVHTD